MATWGEFEAAAPALAAFGAERLLARPAYLATLRSGYRPRVHPVTPIIGEGRLFLFMEPTSPKIHDLRQRRWYALHNGVVDNSGTGGEFTAKGIGVWRDDAEARDLATRSATYEVLGRYVLFELTVADARCHGYGDVELPEPRSWSDSQP